MTRARRPYKALGVGHIIYVRIIGLLSYRIISYHIISYHIISYHMPISYHIISYHISYHIMSCHRPISYHIISYHIISYHIISYHIISYYIISYQTSLQYAYHSTSNNKHSKTEHKGFIEDMNKRGKKRPEATMIKKSNTLSTQIRKARAYTNHTHDGPTRMPKMHLHLLVAAGPLGAWELANNSRIYFPSGIWGIFFAGHFSWLFLGVKRFSLNFHLVHLKFRWF